MLSVSAVVADLQPAAQPEDITSLNSLATPRQPKVDPKLRKALLRVLNKIKEEENGQLPADIPEEDFIKVIGDPIQSEDLGSLEVTDEQAADPTFPYKEALRFGQRIINGQQEQQEGGEEQDPQEQGGDQQQTGGQEADFSGYLIGPPQNQGDFFGQNGNAEDSYYYERPTSGSFGSGEQTEDSASASKGYTDPNIQQEASTPSPSTPESVTTTDKDDSAKPSEGVKKDDSHTEPEVTTPQEELAIEQTSKIEGDAEIVPDLVGNEAIEGRNPRNNVFEGDAENFVQEGIAESKIVSTNHSFSIQYSSEPSFLPTKSTPSAEDQPDKSISNSTPILKSVENIEKTPEIITSEDEHKKDTITTDKKKDDKVKHVVDFAPAPLITAFTVQQDDKGVPHRVIPLDYENLTKPPPTTEDPEIVAQRHRELEEKEFILQQQLRSLQQERYKYSGGPKPVTEELLRFQHEEELRRQQEIFQQQIQQAQSLSHLQQQRLQPQSQFPLQPQPIQLPSSLGFQGQITQSIEHQIPTNFAQGSQQLFTQNQQHNSNQQQRQHLSFQQYSPNQQFQQQSVPNQQFQRQSVPNQQFQQQPVLNQQAQQQSLVNQQFQQQSVPNQQFHQQPLPNQHFQQAPLPNQQAQHQSLPNQQFQQPLLPNQQNQKHSFPNQQFQQKPLPKLQFQQQPLSNQHHFHQQQFQRQPTVQKSQALEPEEFLRQQEIIQYRQNLLRQQELQRQESQRQDAYRQQEHFKRQQFERQRNQQRPPFLQNQNLEFQKSVDYRLQLFDHNRVHRQEPSRFVSNVGFNRPVTISGQIQNLISQSGINTGLPQNTQTDLSIVSKILAFDFENPKPQVVKNNIKRQLPKVTKLKEITASAVI